MGEVNFILPIKSKFLMDEMILVRTCSFFSDYLVLMVEIKNFVSSMSKL